MGGWENRKKAIGKGATREPEDKKVEDTEGAHDIGRGGGKTGDGNRMRRR